MQIEPSQNIYSTGLFSGHARVDYTLNFTPSELHVYFKMSNAESRDVTAAY